jgi:N-acetylmuramoyl-L-alanine amidase
MPGGPSRFVSLMLVAVAVAGTVVVLRPATATAQANLSDVFQWLESEATAQTTIEKPAQPVSPAPVASPPQSEATAVGILGDKTETLFQLTLTRGVTAEVYTLANPYRVIVDLPGVSFKLPAESGRDARGLVSAFRYGQFDEGKARIVLDTTGPIAIAKAAMTNARSGPGVVLTIELKSTESPTDHATPALPKRATAKPIIVIDPGHGGIDPGAVGAANLLEKDLVLTVSSRVRELLEQSGRYDIVMTRARDVFVSLSERLKISRQAGADLFISIHADSIEQAYAQSIKGATVYTLSERASDAEARAIAEKENASDLIAGLDVAGGEENDDVKNILLDLMKRETANFSAEFSRTLVAKLKSNISLSRDPERAAAFKVLRQTHAPSVLVELGYVSNPDESRQMQSARWQEKVAKSIVTAVDTYFSKRASVSR